MIYEHLFGSIARRIERAIGIERLKPNVRAQLLTEQIQSIVELTPATAVGAVLVSFLVLVVASDASVLVPVTFWALALYAVLFPGLRAWRRSRHRPPGRSASQRAVRRACLNAFILGVVWGILPMAMLPIEASAPKLVTGIVIAGVLCVSGIALAILPVAALAFNVPVIIGATLAVFRMEGPVETFTFGFLLLSYLAVMPYITLRLARNFVRQRSSESQIREQKDIISLLLKEFEESSSDWLWEFDRDGRIQRVSDRFVAASRLEQGDLVGRDFCAFLRSVGPDNAAIVTEIARDIDDRATFHNIELRVGSDTDERWWRLTGKPSHDEFGQYNGYIGTASDVTTEKIAERRINYLAHNDALTGLLNRGKFTEHLKSCVARLERYGSPFAVLYLDLDQFKAVNDSRGHLIGDRLLVEVGRRIRAAARETDVVARLGGDEFAIILTSGCDVSAASALAARLVEEVGRAYEFEEEVVVIGVSIGIALAPVNGTRPDQLLRNADLALYRAKAEGKGAYRFFESQMDSDVRERRMLELELRQALKDGDFVLHYQPLVSAEDNRPTGFEALVRWNHPIRGIVQPAEFIPIAEQTGLIMQIGDWTIREACRAASGWPDDMIVAVNLSAKHFQHSDIAAVVRDALASSGLPPHRLELEITESLLIERPEDVIGRLAEIKGLGVTIAMDDFGTGYSSLSYLLKFPFDKIKIDKSFVTASSEDVVARDILRSIASLGRTLRIRITAEGVETQEQVDFLRDIACHQLQGFYFARPLSEIDLAAYFLNNFQAGDRHGQGQVLKAATPDEMRAAS
jgi:diguanylate cyclase (GGDEF)-like protein/PAS domain S-box-containing protein